MLKYPDCSVVPSPGPGLADWAESNPGTLNALRALGGQAKVSRAAQGGLWPRAVELGGFRGAVSSELGLCRRNFNRRWIPGVHECRRVGRPGSASRTTECEDQSSWEGAAPPGPSPPRLPGCAKGLFHLCCKAGGEDFKRTIRSAVQTGPAKEAH